MGTLKKAFEIYISLWFLLIKVKTLKAYGKLWNRIIDLIRSKTNNSNNYDEKYMKIKFNSDDD